MWALAAAMNWSSARLWSARMRAVSSIAAAWACSARVTAAASACRLGRRPARLLAVGACVVALGLGVPAALDLFGKAGLGRCNALVGAGAGGLHLGFRGLDITHGARPAGGMN
jgi:hypothetical protein